MCGKRDWGIRTGESDIKFKRITELKIVNEQVFIEIVIKHWEIDGLDSKMRNLKLAIIDTHIIEICFFPAGSFQNVTKFF